MFLYYYEKLIVPNNVVTIFLSVKSQYHSSKNASNVSVFIHLIKRDTGNAAFLRIVFQNFQSQIIRETDRQLFWGSFENI